MKKENTKITSSRYLMNEQKPHIQRMVEEQDELNIRINKLHNFMKSKTFKTLTFYQKFLMKKQLKTMKKYFNILDKRINNDVIVDIKKNKFSIFKSFKVAAILDLVLFVCAIIGIYLKFFTNIPVNNIILSVFIISVVLDTIAFVFLILKKLKSKLKK